MRVVGRGGRDWGGRLGHLKAVRVSFSVCVCMCETLPCVRYAMQGGRTVRSKSWVYKLLWVRKVLIGEEG